MGCSPWYPSALRHAQIGAQCQACEKITENDPLQYPVRYTAVAGLAYGSPCVLAHKAGRQPLGKAQVIAFPWEKGDRMRWMRDTYGFMVFPHQSPVRFAAGGNFASISLRYSDL